MELQLKRQLGLPSVFADILNPLPFFGRELGDNGFGLLQHRLGTSVPTVNISETSKEYCLDVAAPGMERKDFEIEINNHTLTISAEKEAKKEEKSEEYSMQEWSFNSFSRSFTLPENTKQDKVSAKYENGILKITIPKQKETAIKPSHRIAVS